MKSDPERLREFRIEIRIEERHGLTRVNEPVRIGIPFPRGLIFDAREIIVCDQQALPVPCQARVLAQWSDGSAKWVLVDALVVLKADEHAVIVVQRQPSLENSVYDSIQTGMSLAEEAGQIVVNTGPGSFYIARDSFGPLQAVRLGSLEMLAAKASEVRVRAMNGKEYAPVVDNVQVEESGPVRTTILVEGGFANGDRPFPLLFKSRLVFYAGSTCVHMEFQIRNPQAAHHPGGMWDLGDGGSCLLKDLSIYLYPRAKTRNIEWYADGTGRTHRGDGEYFCLYQDSSGGENWDSLNHLNASDELSVSFQGYRITAGPSTERRLIGMGRRATPSLQVSSEEGWIAATTKEFWQNFPKALRQQDGVLSIGLFPSECSSGFEIQGGEQKRHTVHLDFGVTGEKSVIANVQNPLAVSVDPYWAEKSGALPWFAVSGDDSNERYLKYIGNIVNGPDSFFHKRELADEFGWRNYGDLYADHEAVHHRGPKPMVAHYNNQYDFIYGALIQFLRTGDSRWRQLMEDAACHTIDIDIYHTDQDRSAYSHGLFWHTDHYMDAKSCTHRTYSRKNATGAYGGGPSNEHNYTSGLLHFHYLTGDPEAANAVIELAGWVMAMDDGARTILGFLDDGPTGAASQTVSKDYHKPGRGAGNSINALMDAYALTNNRHYLNKAEELVQRCIHPEDQIATLKLDEPEYRWSYLVFLQVLGKYLELKAELGERDYLFHYARDSLLHYAEWMARNEVPYKDVLHKVLLPTESWPAHDVRKSHVFHLAAKYGPSASQPAFRERARYFFDRCLTDVLSFDSAFLTRPLVILCTYGYVHAYFQEERGDISGDIRHRYSFGHPEQFIPQRSRIRATLLKKYQNVTNELRRLLLNKWRELKRRMFPK